MTSQRKDALPELHPLLTSRIAGADGMRALAALGVIFSHLYQRLNMDAQEPWYQGLQAFFMHGAYGVSTFFVLSGMLLSYPFWVSFITGTKRPSLRHYAKRRAARIVPAYYASLAVSFVVGLALFPGTQEPLRRLIAAALFYSGFHYVTFFPTESNGPLWSISLEVFSYVLLPLALALLWIPVVRRVRGVALRTWLAGGYWLAVIGVTMLINSQILQRVVLSDLQKGWDFGQVGGAKFWVPGYNPLGFFGHFAIGVLAAWVIVAWRVRVAGPQVTAKAVSQGMEQPQVTAQRWWWDVVAWAGALGTLTLLALSLDPAEPQHDSGFQMQPYGYPVFAGLVALTLVGLANSRRLARAFDNRFLRYTATVSFGLYVWHYLVIQWIEYMSGGRFVYGAITNWVEHLWFSGAVLVMAYAIATLSWRFIEKPVLSARWTK